jgi:type II secretory pathway pseudopilin PulG
MGFSLVETLMATLILSGSVLALATISTNALTDTTRNTHYEQAAAVIDQQLSMIDYVGIDQFLKLEQTEGDNEDFGTAYHWKVSTEYEGTDNLYIVTIMVTWAERNRPYSVTAQTMLDGTGLTATKTTTSEAGQP